MSKNNGSKPVRQGVIITIRDTDDKKGFTASMVCEPSATKCNYVSPSLNAAVRLKSIFQNHYEELRAPFQPKQEESKIIIPAF